MGSWKIVSINLSSRVYESTCLTPGICTYKQPSVWPKTWMPCQNIGKNHLIKSPGLAFTSSINWKQCARSQWGYFKGHSSLSFIIHNCVSYKPPFLSLYVCSLCYILMRNKILFLDRTKRKPFQVLRITALSNEVLRNHKISSSANTHDRVKVFWWQFCPQWFCPSSNCPSSKFLSSNWTFLVLTSL